MRLTSKRLVAGEQGAGGGREILHASPAAKPGRIFQAAAIVGVNVAAVRADLRPRRLRTSLFDRGSVGHADQKPVRAAARAVVEAGLTDLTLGARGGWVEVTLACA